jgi:Xaa-Pro aminopeptidase
VITMENVLKRGRTVWDRSLLPEDEYIERVRALREAMETAGLDGIVSVGHSTHTGNFTYLSGSVPPLGWMGIVLGREAGPFLVSGGGSRELFFLRTQTWLLDDIRTSRSLFSGPAAVVVDAVDEFMQPGGRLGLVGAREDLSPAAHAELVEALDAYELVEVDHLLAELRAVKRPREQAVQRRALEAARGSVAAALAAWEGGASATAALIAAEKEARMRGCRDARVLGTLDGEQLAPVEEHGEGRGEHLLVYVAVERLGYWAQAVGDSEGDSADPASDAARRAVDAMVAAAGPGVAAGELVDAAVRELPEGASDVALSYGLGGGIGLDLTEDPVLRPGAADTLQAGAVLALQAFTVVGGRLGGATEMVRVDAEGVTLL